MVIGQECDANGQPVFPPVGLADKQLDKIQRELLALCQLIQPPYFPVLSIEEVEGRKLMRPTAGFGLAAIVRGRMPGKVESKGRIRQKPF